MTGAATARLDVVPRALPESEQEAVEAAEAQVRPGDLRALVADLVNIASPTGEEGPLARYITDALNSSGIEGRYQPIDRQQANAIGRIRGTGDGASVLLYAPIDTVTTGNTEEDCPGVGDELRSDMRPQAADQGPWVVGLGASNPKGHAACVIAAARAIKAAGVRLRGDLLVGLGAGGMPTNRRDSAAIDRFNTGQGSGCSFMLEQGVQADFAVIAKPGWAVAWEEVGLCWFRVRVHGLFSYVGARRRIPYRNPIVEAAKVIPDLEEWAAEYAARNTSGLVAPQAQIGAIDSGWVRMPSFTSAVCDLWLDVRISPRTPPVEVQRQFREALAAIERRHPGVRLSSQLEVSIPGTSTSSGSWIVQSAARAFEAVEGRPQQTITETSGATDANILRNRGLATARVGMPKVAGADGAEVDFSLGMNAVDVTDMVKLTRVLVRTAIETCSQPASAAGRRLGGD